MDEKTVFIYETAAGSVVFGYDSPFWITDFSGLSEIEVDVYESRGIQQIGSTVTGQSVKPRPLTIDGCIFDPVDTNRDILINAVSPQLPATFTMIDKEAAWYLDVIPKKTPAILPGKGVQNFQMQLYAPYPYWRSTKRYSSQISGIAPMFKFPFNTGGKWWVSKYSDDFFANINNGGNIPIELQIVFTAKADLSTPELYHVGTGKKIKILKSMEAGEQIIVSTVYGKRGVTCVDVNGVKTNGFRYLSLDSDLSMTLLPGENLLRSDAENNKEWLGVRLEAPAGVKSGV